jgi:DNA-3-methyladenine glycosylase II
METRPRIIANYDDLDEGVQQLCRLEPKFSSVVDVCPSLDLRRHDDGFERLLSAIVSQQLSVAAASTIWQRLVDAGVTSPQAINQSSDEILRSLGLSKQKISYARSLVDANIDFLALREMTTPEVIETLTQVKGIGEWTAEIYAMFSLGHADVFAHNDLALQEGARLLLDLPSRPKLAQMRQIASAWSPWRAIAARLLWAYYAYHKARPGVNN